MKFNTRKEGDILIIELEGRLDVNISLELEKEVNRLIDEGEECLLFDLAKLQYLFSSGLRVFVATMRRLNGINGSMKMANMSHSVKTVFSVVGLDDLFSNHDSVDDALKAFQESV
ncbi:MAG TPA: anti-sigma factor antagonist [Spirochaetes bacterium]|nr:anti-sigma factor antagonist [Spirochaetota bacterium]